MKQMWRLGCVRNARRRPQPITAPRCLGLTSQKTSAAATPYPAFRRTCCPLVLMCRARKAVLWRAVGMKADDDLVGSATPDRHCNRQRGYKLVMGLDLGETGLWNVEVSVLLEAEQ
jgi:hypothetical protein